MGDDSSDEIVLAETASSGSSEISIVEVATRRPRSRARARKGSPRRLDGPRPKKKALEKVAGARRSQAPKKPKCGAGGEKGLCNVRVVERDEERVFHLRATDTLEKVYQAYHREDSPARMKYRSVPVSRHLTLEEMGFDDSHCITIHRQGEVQPSTGVEIKVNIDGSIVVELSLCKNLAVGKIFEQLEAMGHGGDLLVRNGIVLDEAADVGSAVKTGDVVDLVSRAGLVYRG